MAKLRSRIQNLMIRTTFITGFPGETEEQCQELVEFVAEQRFERMGVFTYSFEPDTPAARLAGHLDDATKETRRRRVMQAQQQWLSNGISRQIGRRIEVIWTGRCRAKKMPGSVVAMPTRRTSIRWFMLPVASWRRARWSNVKS